MLSNMEEHNKSSSTTTNDAENSNYLRSSFLIHRGHNNSIASEEAFFDTYTTIADSGYSSSHNCSNFTPNNTPNVSSLSSSSVVLTSIPSTIVTTPQKTSNCNFSNSNLITIPEIPDSVKLTPVTRNIHIFSNIHITTPKSQDFLHNAVVSENLNICSGAKRSALSELKFDDYQNTPKKKRIDSDLESNPRNILHTTPLRGINRKSLTKSQKKLLYRQKLHSAPDLNYIHDDNTENLNAVVDGNISYGASQFTPIRSPFLFRENRTPLSSTSSNLIQASTPKSISKFDDGYTTSSLYCEKPASVRKLLSFSDKEFEALLSSSSTVLKEPSLKSTLTSVTAANNSTNTIDIYQEDSFREYKKKQPIISSYTTVISPYVPETIAAKRSFKRTLKFAYQPTPTDEIIVDTPEESFSEGKSSIEDEDSTTTFHDDSLKDYKSLYPVIDDVIRNRRILKRERTSTTARLVDIKRESNLITRSNKIRKTHLMPEAFIQTIQLQSKSEEEMIKESKKGFQEILGYVPSSYDLKITTKVDESKDEDEVNSGDIERKLSSGGSDMDISPNVVKNTPYTAVSSGCQSLRDFKVKLLENNEEDSYKLNSDLDISKEFLQSPGNLVLIETTPESLKSITADTVEENIFAASNGSQSIKTLELDNAAPYLNNALINIADDSWLSNTDFEAGILTPPRRRSLSPSDSNGNVLKTSFCETERFLPSTPKKMKQHQNSRSSIDFERNEILYPSIPRTPKKLSSSQLIKHKSFNVIAPSIVPLKRKASIIKDKEKRTKVFYDGLTHLNIITKLESYNLVLDRIFNMLSSHDLMNLTLASKNLRNVVLNNQKAKQRILNYLTEIEKIKENSILDNNNKDDVSASILDYPHRNSLISASGGLSLSSRLNSIAQMKKILTLNDIGNRMPFKCSNSIFDRRRPSITIQKSPPVSPSKRKFYENQKVVKLLSGHEKLVKCPRCSRSSRIIHKISSTLDANGNQQNDGGGLPLTTMYSSIKTQQSFQLLSTKSTSKNFNHYYPYDNKNNNNNNDHGGDDLIPYSKSQPVSSTLSKYSLVPQSTAGTTTKSKFVKSMSADSALYLPRTPKKHKHQLHYQPHSVDSTATTSDDDDDGDDIVIANNRNIPSTIKYGQCTGIACKFRFCLDCLCEYHPNAACKISSTINNSPTKDDVQNDILLMNPSVYTVSKTNMPIVAVPAVSHANNNTTSMITSSSSSRSLKTRRKSLKRLCF